MLNRTALSPETLKTLLLSISEGLARDQSSIGPWIVYPFWTCHLKVFSTPSMLTTMVPSDLFSIIFPGCESDDHTPIMRRRIVESLVVVVQAVNNKLNANNVDMNLIVLFLLFVLFVLI